MIPAGSFEAELEEAPRKAHMGQPASLCLCAYCRTCQLSWVLLEPLLAAGELGSVLNVSAMPFNFLALLLLSWLWERGVFWGELMFELKPISPSLAEQD